MTAQMNDSDYLQMAYQFAWHCSDDPDTKNAAVAVDKYGAAITIGTNCFPEGVEVTPARLERPAKYYWMEHAERAAIYQAGVGNVHTLYCPWFACADCARAIIAFGVKEVVGHKQMMDRTPDRWRESVDAGWQMMRERGIELRMFDGTIGNCSALFNGEVWEP